MNKLLAVGCSITHGAETVSDSYDIADTEFSYAKHLADYYQAEYHNVAYPGASNEIIFHRTVESLTTQPYTHCVIGWTSLHREAWEKDNVVWTFSANYGRCNDNNAIAQSFVKKHPVASLTSNRVELVNQVQQFWETLHIKLLNDFPEQKLTHYRSMVQLLCKTNNIKLIEISVFPTGQVDLFNLPYLGRHSNREEHKKIYQDIIKQHPRLIESENGHIRL